MSKFEKKLQQRLEKYENFEKETDKLLYQNKKILENTQKIIKK